MSTYKAFLIASAIINEKEHGTKHYRSSTGELLMDASKILNALRDNDLEVQPTCQICGKATPLLPLSERYCDDCKRRIKRY